MAKPMNDALYRKLDVDQYDPDQFDDTEEADTPGIGPDEAQVRQLLQSSRLNEALKAALANPPLKTKNQVGTFNNVGGLTYVISRRSRTRPPRWSRRC